MRSKSGSPIELRKHLNPKMNPLDEIPQIKAERLVVEDPDSSLTDAMRDYKHREGIVYRQLNY